MPTERNGWVRRYLRDKKVKVVRRFPFTIQLLYESSEIVKETILGVDAQRYKIQPKDIIEYKGKRYLVGGIQNKGAYVLFWGSNKERIVKSVKDIKVIFHQGSFYEKK